jgi:hypothetical protein
MRFADGTEKNTLISSVRKITFSGGNLILSNPDTSTNSYAVSGIRKLIFGVYSGIYDITSNQSAIGLYPCPATNYIRLQNIPDGSTNIRIFNLGGVELININLSSVSQQIDVSELPRGMYILKTLNKTLKFIKL